MATSGDIARYRENWQKEIDGVFQYRALAEAEKDEKLAEVYRRLAASEEKHAAVWEGKLKEAGKSVPVRQISWRARTLGTLAKWFGPKFVVGSIVGNEAADSRAYDDQPEAETTSMAADEKSHARLLVKVTGVASGNTGSAVAMVEGRHRSAGGNALRAAVLGANDGLVSILSLVMGVAGANLPSSDVLIAGLAGLLAGAGSMAMGEWLSVQSSRELYQHQIAIEKEEIESAPEEEQEELALIYQSKGLSESRAQELAAQIMKDSSVTLDTLAREELGIDPGELGGSAWEAAITSFLLFAFGAVFPVFPYFFWSGLTAIYISLGVSSIGLFIIGAAITLMTGRGVLYSGFRQVLFGLAAAGLTYGVGRLIGVSVAG
ncbi:MAG: VIT1/CCC1 transporter family protein [Bacteroidota bacterium]